MCLFVRMEVLSKKQRNILYVQLFHKNQSVVGAQREWRKLFKCSPRDIPSRKDILRAVENFAEIGEITDQRKNNRRLVTVRTEENLQAIRASVNLTPRKTLQVRSEELGISKATLWRAMRHDLKLYPYKVQTSQALSKIHKKKRVAMCEMFSDKMENDENWIKKVWFTDEAHFHLNGTVNRQNYRYWGTTNPKLDPQEKPLHSPKVTAWVALSSKGVIGPFWFVDDDGKTTTVNQHNYQSVVKQFYSEIRSNRLGIRDLWFMQDGATCHTAKSTLAYLKSLFGNRIISGNRSGVPDFPWSPNSPDLNPLDFFLWGYCKDSVYKNSPGTLDELKAEVETLVSGITPDMLQRVIENFGIRVNAVLAKKGSHIEHVVV